MKHFIVLMLGVAAFFGFAVAAELGALPSWAGGAMLAFGVLLLLYAWRSWGRLMAWVFGKNDDKIK